MHLTERQIRDDLQRAYEDARRYKRWTLSQQEFEENMEVDLEGLTYQLITYSYIPLPAFCFITFDPVQREVFASQFRDRIVQHMLYNYLAPLFETQFIYDTYSCRIGKGTLFGVERFCHHLRSVTNNFTREAYVLMADLSGYFMSIDKELLIDNIMATLYKYEHRMSDDKKHTWGERIDFEFCEYLLHCFLDRNPAADCIRLGKPSNWNGLPANKMLANSPEGVGIVIGDIISQLFSNINLTPTDQWAKREMHLHHWGHYVDDHFCMHQDKDFLTELKDEILPVKFKELAHVNIHPKKCHITPAYGAHRFLGTYIYPHYRVPRQRTINKLCNKASLMEYELMIREPDYTLLSDTQASINSYLGLLRQTKSFHLRQSIFDKTAFNNYFTFDEYYMKATLKEEYRENNSWI